MIWCVFQFKGPLLQSKIFDFSCLFPSLTLSSCPSNAFRPQRVSFFPWSGAFFRRPSLALLDPCSHCTVLSGPRTHLWVLHQAWMGSSLLAVHFTLCHTHSCTPDSLRSDSPELILLVWMFIFQLCLNQNLYYTCGLWIILCILWLLLNVKGNSYVSGCLYFMATRKWPWYIFHPVVSSWMFFSFHEELAEDACKGRKKN